ncbi:MAG: class I SAM-dependent methyltransferase [Deltaproteobacteria bacterium]|nr:class I SAM-dependent methyltransferase [Deltaproteobacteria bacterium]
MGGQEWEDRYTTGDLPWDTGEPDLHLVEVVRARKLEGRTALEIGCGTGTNALWLAHQRFNVLGVDISPSAIDKARAKLCDPDLNCRFAALNFLTTTVPTGPFDFVFDRGCFHVFDDHHDRARFAAQVAAHLSADGLWLSLIGSTEGPPRDHGPPRRSAAEVVAAIEPHLQILELRLVDFRANVPTPATAWLCVSGPRRVAAQPSTKRA